MKSKFTAPGQINSQEIVAYCTLHCQAGNTTGMVVPPLKVLEAKCRTSRLFPTREEHLVGQKETSVSCFGWGSATAWAKCADSETMQWVLLLLTYVHQSISLITPCLDLVLHIYCVSESIWYSNISGNRQVVLVTIIKMYACDWGERPWNHIFMINDVNPSW